LDFYFIYVLFYFLFLLSLLSGAVHENCFDTKTKKKPFYLVGHARHEQMKTTGQSTNQPTQMIKIKTCAKTKNQKPKSITKSKSKPKEQSENRI